MHNQPDEFDQIIHGNGYGIRPEFTDPNPYGIPAQPAKTGLTPRGKAALGIGGAFIACGSLFGWQHYAAQQATAETKAQEIALKQAELRLAELRELNKASTAQAETQAAAETARQKRIDACVSDNKDLVGKQLGVTYGRVVEDCQSQYPATVNGDMQAAATASGTAGTGDGGGSIGLLLGGGALVVGLVVAAKKNTKSSTA